MPDQINPQADANFEYAFAYTLVNEGGYTNDPNDPGGPTNFGITQHDYAVFKGRSVSAAEVKAMTLADAKTIYRTKYWNTLSLDYINDRAIATCMFDEGVNFGISIAAKFAQQICKVSADGHIGPISIAAINGSTEQVFIPAFVDLCKARYKSLLWKPSNWTFYKGWMARANRLLSLMA